MDTTMAQVEDVRARMARGETHKEIVEATGLSPTTVSRIKDGWKPSGRKAITLFPNTSKNYWRGR